VNIRFSLGIWFQQYQNVAGIARITNITLAHGGKHARHIRILSDDVNDLLLMTSHLCKRNAFACFCVANYLTCVVIGNESLGNKIKEYDCHHEENGTNQHRERSMLQHDFESPFVSSR